MADLLIHTYRFFRRQRTLFYLFLAGTALLTVALASRISFEEDISRSVPGRDSGDITGKVLKNLKFTDKLILDITLRDSLAAPDPEKLSAVGEKIVDSLRARFDTAIIQSITFRIADSAMDALMTTVVNHLPTFLDISDYQRLDTILLPASIEASLDRNYRILASPASMILKKRIQQDPLGISNLAFEKLTALKPDDNFEIHDGSVFTSDMRHLMIFVVPANPSSETSLNDRLITGLDEIAGNLAASDPTLQMQYFGGTAVAVSNARQLKKDIALTLIIAFILIFLLIGWYFKSAIVPLLGLLPAIFGGALALAILYLTKGSISAISLGIGSVILGLIIDYSLYFVNHFRRHRNIEKMLKEMSLTIVLCCLTSVGAFLCLTFLNSAVLEDLGWFAAISVTGAALFTLVILPQLLHLNIMPAENIHRDTLIDKIARHPFERNRWLIAGLISIVVLSLWFAGKAGFETNMSALSFVTPKLVKAEADLDRISNYKLKNIFLIATGENTEEALRKREHLARQAESLIGSGVINGVTHAGALLSSDSLQKLKIERWNRYWTTDKKAALRTNLRNAAQKYGYKTGAFESFLNLPDREFKPLHFGTEEVANNPMLADWLTVANGIALAPMILKVKEEDKELVYRTFPPNSSYLLFDKQRLTEQFVSNVKEDFELLVTLSMSFVTLLLILSFGRLGLGLITAVPMYLSWLITLGFMGLTGLSFNIFNIIVSSFVFGLGVDYSILMMRGLQNTLKTGRDDMQPYKVSILLSSVTTLLGVGALVFTRHPALNSIALVSIVGIVSVVIMSFVFQPLVFHWLILSRQQRHTFPITLRIVIKTFVTWGNIVAIAILLMIAGTAINLLLPIPRKKKELLFHLLFYLLTKAYIAFTFAFDRKLINDNGEDFRKPAIIISNHQSLIETPAFLRLYPKIIILTTTWVHHSLVFGPIARLANFYNVDEGLDNLMDRLKEKVAEGFSILIFPEAHRSADHHIQRFHRGAFYLAEKLQVDLLPVLVFGTGDFLGKGAFWGRPNSFRMKILNRVSCGDNSFGVTYQERARKFRQFYIEQYAKFRQEEGDAHYYRRLLALNYVLKGPVLEWYMRVKLKLEDDYEPYNRLMPRYGEILDLGCGYGFIAYMLMFTSPQRSITGVDYDAEKIDIASNCFSRNERISFSAADISEYPITPKSGFVLSDVLHYLEPGRQDELLRACCRNLLPGGTILIREANSELTERHRQSKFTEFFSTRTGFNKTSGPEKEVWFTSASRISLIAKEFGLGMEVVDLKKVTSNNLFVLKKVD